MGVQQLAEEAERRTREMEAVFESVSEAIVVYDRDGHFVAANHTARDEFGLDPSGRTREEVFGRLDARDLDGKLVPLDSLPSARALRGERVTAATFTIRAASGERLVVVVSSSPVSEEGALNGAVSVWRDITAQFEAQQQLAKELERTRILLGVATSLGDEVDLHDVVGTVAHAVLDAVPHTRVLVGLLSDDGGCLEVAASAGETPVPAGQSMMLADAAPGVRRAAATYRPQVVDYDADILADGLLRRFHARQALWIPMAHGGKLTGLIAIDDPGGRRDFDEREIEMARSIAYQAATAIDNARLYEERKQSLHALADKDRAIRNAYSDVIDAITGGRLIILGKDELDEDILTRGAAAFGITEPSQLSEARARLRAIVGDVPGIRDLELAFSEGVTNMLKHAGGGTYVIDRDPRRVQIVLSDTGPGIDFRNLPKATLVPGFSTEQTLGMGFTLMMDLTDRLLLCTDPSGTTLVLEKGV